MACVIRSHHLDVWPRIAEDIAKEQGMPRGFKESSSKANGREPVTPPREEGSQRLQSFEQQIEGSA